MQYIPGGKFFVPVPSLDFDDSMFLHPSKNGLKK
jgi:hypothetical protein